MYTWIEPRKPGHMSPARQPDIRHLGAAYFLVAAGFTALVAADVISKFI